MVLERTFRNTFTLCWVERVLDEKRKPNILDIETFATLGSAQTKYARAL